MNEENGPITWPTAKPASLSADAQHFYAVVESHRPLDRDYFAERAKHRYVSQADADAYQPDERTLAAIAELEAVGLASYMPEYKALSIQRVAKQYTVAEGRGSQLIRVFLEEGFNRVLLAVLVGGDIESRSASGDGLSRLTVRSRHAIATDVEHDASSTAQLTVAAPSYPAFGGYGEMTFTGFLTEAHLYALGEDPLTQKGFDPAELCDRCEGEDEHPYAPYLPPQVALPPTAVGTVVQVSCLPLRPYLVAASA
jgi:hypothetical protein